VPDVIQLDLFGRREQIRLGLHLCQLWSRPAEAVEATAALLRDGLKGRDKCYVAAPPARLDETREALRAARIDLEHASASGQLEVVADRGGLLERGRFDPYHLVASHQALIARAQADGWESVRAVVDMDWLAAGSGAGSTELLKYEAAADAVFTFQSRPIVALAQYGYATLPGELVVELLKLHPFAVVGRAVKRNPYYLDAERYALDLIRDELWGGPRRLPQRDPNDPLVAALETLTLAAAGYTPREVAEMRGRSAAQVRADLERILAHLGTPTLAKAIAEARRRGLID
jgi:DNA-binding CsgD family transcriptional regulator